MNNTEDRKGQSSDSRQRQKALLQSVARAVGSALGAVTSALTSTPGKRVRTGSGPTKDRKLAEQSMQPSARRHTVKKKAKPLAGRGSQKKQRKPKKRR